MVNPLHFSLAGLNRADFSMAVVPKEIHGPDGWVQRVK